MNRRKMTRPRTANPATTRNEPGREVPTHRIVIIQNGQFVRPLCRVGKQR
jgi:hypothetical protein